MDITHGLMMSLNLVWKGRLQDCFKVSGDPNLGRTELVKRQQWSNIMNLKRLVSFNGAVKERFRSHMRNEKNTDSISSLNQKHPSLDDKAWSH